MQNCQQAPTIFSRLYTGEKEEYWPLTKISLPKLQKVQRLFNRWGERTVMRNNYTAIATVHHDFRLPA
jgi:hypothetical protein